MDTEKIILFAVGAIAGYYAYAHFAKTGKAA
jgi:hypothetical protein